MQTDANEVADVCRCVQHATRGIWLTAKDMADMAILRGGLVACRLLANSEPEFPVSLVPWTVEPTRIECEWQKRIYTPTGACLLVIPIITIPIIIIIIPSNYLVFFLLQLS